MTEAAQQPAPPAPPANAAEASARLGTLTADKAWSDKLLAGDPYAAKEFHALTTMVADGGDNVDRAMTGILPDVPDSDLKHMSGTADMLRAIGISDGATRQTLSDHEVGQAEFDAVTAWKSQRMKSPEFVKQFLANEPDAVREMTLANIVLSSSIKKQEAAA
jgi:hypothetical protein